MTQEAEQAGGLRNSPGLAGGEIHHGNCADRGPERPSLAPGRRRQRPPQLRRSGGGGELGKARRTVGVETAAELVKEEQKTRAGKGNPPPCWRSLGRDECP